MSKPTSSDFMHSSSARCAPHSKRMRLVNADLRPGQRRSKVVKKWRGGEASAHAERGGRLRRTAAQLFELVAVGQAALLGCRSADLSGWHCGVCYRDFCTAWHGLAIALGRAQAGATGRFEKRSGYWSSKASEQRLPRTRSASCWTMVDGSSNIQPRTEMPPSCRTACEGSASWAEAGWGSGAMQHEDGSMLGGQSAILRRAPITSPITAPSFPYAVSMISDSSARASSRCETSGDRSAPTMSAIVNSGDCEPCATAVSPTAWPSSRVSCARKDVSASRC